MRELMVIAAVFFMLLHLPPASAQECQTAQAPTNAEESISCATPRGNTEVWRIDRPNVKQPDITYSSIRFRQGDLISVFAGGCVQTGGSGLTWKRYVNPTARSKGDDDQYHGLIRLPGSPGLQHIRNAVLAGGVPVLADPGVDASLHLGYVDDGYGDNGYWGHDDGWWQQCNDLPDAWVVIVIQHDCAASASNDCVHGRALDLVVDAQDPNGFPVNPNWVYRVLTGFSPSPSDVCSWSTKIGGFPVDDASLCASELTERDSKWVCVQGGTSGAIAGHMNWIARPVTYQGWIWWEGHDYYWDDDYTLNVAALDANGSVSGSLFVAGQFNPQVEFDSDETVDQFGGVPWWSNFKNAVDNEDQVLHTANATPTGVPKPGEYFPAGGLAIVIGQLGLDCGHSCGTELHPAWAFFVHTQDDVRDDVWAFFIRNWGNEGFCSGNDHQPGNQQTFTVRLPRPGAVDVALKYPDTVVGMSDPVPPFQIAMDPGGGAALASFTLPPASERGVIYGELHLRWRLPVPGAALSRARSFKDFLATKVEAKESDSAEADLSKRIMRLPDDVRAAFRPPRTPPRPPPNFSALRGRVVHSLAATKPSIERVVAVARPEDDKHQRQKETAVGRLVELERANGIVPDLEPRECNR